MRRLIVGLGIALAGFVPNVKADAQDFRLEEVVSGLENPWSMAFLPDGNMLVTERIGRLQLVENGKLIEIDGVPPVHAVSQGGLLDVVLDPDFSGNGLVYLSYSALVGDKPTTHVARGRLDGRSLTDLEVIFQSNATGVRSKHFGSRMIFDDAGYLYVTHGELGARENAQNTGNHGGSVLRINPDGSVPDDNPFVGQAGHAPEIWTFGNRNPQGMAIHPETQEIWTHEHGPRGGDEINILEAGANFGWPVVSYGKEYMSGFQVGEGVEKPGMTAPIFYWDPSIAPSGMAFYEGDKFPEWQGDLFVGALVYQMLVRLELDGSRIVEEHRLLEGDIGRVRDVRAGPDGYLYLLNDSEVGGIFRIVPNGG